MERVLHHIEQSSAQKLCGANKLLKVKEGLHLFMISCYCMCVYHRLLLCLRMPTSCVCNTFTDIKNKH